MEHSPIQEPSSLAWSALHQLMTAGIERMNGQDFGQHGHPRRILAIDPLGQVASGKGHPQPPLTDTRMNLAINGEPILAALHQTTRLPRPKRPAAPEQEDALEDTGLASPVRTEDEVAPSVERELDVCQAP